MFLAILHTWLITDSFSWPPSSEHRGSQSVQKCTYMCVTVLWMTSAMMNVLSSLLCAPSAHRAPPTVHNTNYSQMLSHSLTYKHLSIFMKLLTYTYFEKYYLIFTKTSTGERQTLSYTKAFGYGNNNNNSVMNRWWKCNIRLHKASKNVHLIIIMKIILKVFSGVISHIM